MSYTARRLLGKELSHVQFRSLEEQLFRAMAVLFDQKERHSVTRLVGMTAPVSIVTPDIVKMPASQERIKAFLDEQYKKLDFALPNATAQQIIADRAKSFADELFKETSPEPKTTRRKI